MPINNNQAVMDCVVEQIKELQTPIFKETGINAVLTELKDLKSFLNSPADSTALPILVAIIDQFTEVNKGTIKLQDAGEALGHLDTLCKLMAASATPDDPRNAILLSVSEQVMKLLPSRPDVESVLGDLQAIKNLKGGPADATSFHDFHVLQLAFENIWVHAFDASLKKQVEQLFREAVIGCHNLGIQLPGFLLNPCKSDDESEMDIDDLNEFIRDVENMITSSIPPMPHAVRLIFPDAEPYWSIMNDEQRLAIIRIAAKYYQEQHYSYTSPAADGSVGGGYTSWSAPSEVSETDKNTVANIIESAKTQGGRLQKLIREIGKSISEPYAFDVFAPGSYNFGVMLTYRQKWEPGEYQAGDLVATIPLAPGETRKYSKKVNVKTSRAVKELEKSMSSHSEQSSETSRAEADIMQKANTATNFKMTAHGSFNIGIGSMDTSSEYSLSQATESVANKKEFHEATLKAAQEYRLERSVEVDCISSTETEETTSGEISNPNNEITVTYLFYELQRRYRISESIYRAQAVILVAQDVPAPNEIDESWLIKYQWILSRVLLDDSFRPALEYLTSGMAGDEVSIEVLKAHWKNQLGLAKALESKVNAQIDMRDTLRNWLTDTTEKEDLVKAAASDIPTVAKIFSFGVAGKIEELEADKLEAYRKAIKTRLEYAEAALADAQDRLKQTTDAYEKATQKYEAALQQQYNRHVAIDQLRIHVKQNILYYMQAIWDHEPPDQRFFRLYKQEITCPGVNPELSDFSVVSGSAVAKPQHPVLAGDQKVTIPDAVKQFQKYITIQGDYKGGGVLPLPKDKVQLNEIADLDNPIGYKGNYMIFPLKKNTDLTDFMLQDFVDDYLGVRDPDQAVEFDWVKFDSRWQAASERERHNLCAELLDYLTAARRTWDDISIPVGQLFIEALPGSHPLLEDFKLLHRVEDVRKVKAEVRHAELENLRLAARLVAGELEDPEIERRILVDKGVGISIDPNQ
ncbi:MAG: hypothetical protein PHW04_09730 [Candidatus Wallbacteria bacterium]|nr:hypothetical protein [Candidatus Wallbacteria bacterium]